MSSLRRAPCSLEIRLHAPTPEVVLLRVNGDLDSATSDVFAFRAGQQLHRAMHLVIDLTDVPFLGVRGLDALRGLHEQAIAVGSQLHLAGPHHAVSHALQVSGLDQLLAVEASAEMIIGLLVAADHARHVAVPGTPSPRPPLRAVPGTPVPSCSSLRGER